jgi:hypothetical protein
MRGTVLRTLTNGRRGGSESWARGVSSAGDLDSMMYCCCADAIEGSSWYGSNPDAVIGGLWRLVPLDMGRETEREGAWRPGQGRWDTLCSARGNVGRGRTARRPCNPCSTVVVCATGRNMITRLQSSIFNNTATNHPLPILQCGRA